MVQAQPERRWQQPLPTMYDLPSDNPEDSGLPDEFHALQPALLSETCRPTTVPLEDCFTAQDLNLYYDPRHTLWYKRPDWFLVLGAKRVEQQEDLRWSYVQWQEGVSPYMIVELLSPGTESEDLGTNLRVVDKPPTKWQVYEQILHVPYYVVYDRKTNQLRVFRLEGGRYQELELPHNQIWLEDVGLGLGLWDGKYQGVEGKWLRWYDADRVCIPTHAERTEQEKHRAEQEKFRAEQEKTRADQEKSRADQAQEFAEQEKSRADQAQELANQEKQRADALVQNQRDAVSRLLGMGLTVEQVAAALAIAIADVQAISDEMG